MHHTATWMHLTPVVVKSRFSSSLYLCSCVFKETVMQNVSLTQSVCTSSRPQLVLAVVSMKHHPQEAPPTGIRSFWKSTILPTPYSTLTRGYVITLTILYMLCHMASIDFGVNVTWLSTALRFEVQGRNQLNTHTVWYSITWPSVDVTWPSYYTVFQDWPHLCCTLHALKGRGITWTPRNRKPEKLRDTLRECEVWHARW